VRIGVFDSGKGGLSVANTIKRAFPDHSVEFVNDAKHVPYGDKTTDEMLQLSLAVLRPLAERTDVIVIACNTLTTNVIGKLRQELDVPLIGMEPMVKPATEQTKSGIIAICATPATLSSRRYSKLKEMYASKITVLEPDCSAWAKMIQSNEMRRHHVHRQIDELCEAGADVIVLGCTHYHWIEDMVNDSADGRAVVLQPEQAVIKRLRKVLSTLPIEP
jgi:glutamate racemase